MHVHGAALNPNATNLYSAVAAEKAAAAKQAADVRKKLLSGALEIEGETEAQDSSVAGAENEEDPNADHNQTDPRAKRKAAKKEDDAEEDGSDDPISIWG